MKAFKHEQIEQLVHYAIGTLRMDFGNALRNHPEQCNHLIDFCRNNGLNNLADEFQNDWEKYKNETIEQIKDAQSNESELNNFYK